VQDLYRLLPILGIFLIFWLLVIRPAQRRQRAVRALQAELAVGDKIITNGGIFGTISAVEDDRLGIEVAEGVVINVARPAVVAVEKEL
jgi:preprotein translocase subunit YajC